MQPQKYSGATGGRVHAGGPAKRRPAPAPPRSGGMSRRRSVARGPGSGRRTPRNHPRSRPRPSRTAGARPGPPSPSACIPRAQSLTTGLSGSTGLPSQRPPLRKDWTGAAGDARAQGAFLPTAQQICVASAGSPAILVIGENPGLHRLLGTARRAVKQRRCPSRASQSGAGPGARRRVSFSSPKDRESPGFMS